VAPLCAPTRASLLTGLNCHAAGMGQVANIDPGFPGYASELPRNQPSLPEILRDNGYSTLAVGKWHVAKDSDLNEAGDKHSWPLQRGFEQYYGFLEALTNFHHPHRMYEGNSVVVTDQYPDGYYLTDDLTNRAERMIREVRAADPTKPFFLYYAHGAAHAPLHAKVEDIEQHRGHYDMGWDRLREQRLARQIELGIVPADTELPPRNFEANEDVKPWDELSPDERRVFARYMEIYAAMVQTIDESVGRLRALLTEMSELDNTIFMLTSDNGASREGRANGTSAYFRDGGTSAAGRGSAVSQEDLDNIDALGGPTTWPHYPRGWAMACGTPFRLYKITTHRGGHSAPLIVSWPERIKDGNQILRRQYTHVTDILPTLCDVLGLDLATSRNGLPARPLAGTSFAQTLENPAAATFHNEQYYECIGHRAYYKDGWAIVSFHPHGVPFPDTPWELFHIDNDINERHDLSAQFPKKVAELAEAWEQAAWANRVFPLDEGTRLNHLLRPPDDARFELPVRIVRDTPTLERWRSSRLVAGRSFRVDIDWAYQRGDEGIVLAHGGQDSGYVLWVESGELHYEHNGFGEPFPGPVISLGDTSFSLTLELTVRDKMWDVAISVDGVMRGRMEGAPVLTRFLPFEGIDVGIDRRSPVSWSLYQRHGCFRFTGSLTAATYTPSPITDEKLGEILATMRELAMALE
jgi:arylsulfatase A-like enzyme